MELNAPLELVWRAITEKELMKKWYFDIPDFKAVVGCKFQFEGSNEDRCYVHLCEVTDVVPLKRIQYSWKYEGYEGISFVTFELASDGDNTHLKLTHDGLETFPHDNPDFDPSNFVGGWTYLIRESLPKYLADKNE